MRKLGKMLQKVLGEIFVQEKHRLRVCPFITVTEVYVSADLGLAKVYLSFMLQEDRKAMLEKVAQQQGLLRKLLGNRIGHHLHKLPVLKFYLDDSALQAVEIHRLLDSASS